jgi:50S ribosomal protein L16 3-hydroxylase
LAVLGWVEPVNELSLPRSPERDEPARTNIARMFESWLGPLDLPTFLARHLGKHPLANQGTAGPLAPLLTWQTLGHIVASPRVPLDLVTVASGRLVDVPAPRSLGAVRGLMERGVSVVVRASEEHDPGLAALAASFPENLGGETHVQVYATPAGTHSYGWHYDFEDVFIAQMAGEKDYYFRANTVALDTRLGDQLDFSGFRKETQPIMAAKLIAGDTLYVPARWWHLVKCTQDSLSISVGVMPEAALREARRLPAGWSGSAAPLRH